MGVPIDIFLSFQAIGNPGIRIPQSLRQSPPFRFLGNAQDFTSHFHNFTQRCLYACTDIVDGTRILVRFHGSKKISCNHIININIIAGNFRAHQWGKCSFETKPDKSWN